MKYTHKARIKNGMLLIFSEWDDNNCLINSHYTAYGEFINLMDHELTRETIIFNLLDSTENDTYIFEPYDGGKDIAITYEVTIKQD